MSKDEKINNVEEEVLQFDDDYEYVMLEDEDGNQTKFELLDEFDFNEKTYAVLFPADDEESEDVIILEVKPGKTDDEAFYITIESQDEIDAVFEAFKQRNPDEFNYID